MVVHWWFMMVKGINGNLMVVAISSQDFLEKKGNSWSGEQWMVGGSLIQVH